MTPPDQHAKSNQRNFPSSFTMHDLSTSTGMPNKFMKLKNAMYILKSNHNNFAIAL